MTKKTKPKVPWRRFLITSKKGSNGQIYKKLLKSYNIFESFIVCNLQESYDKFLHMVNNTIKPQNDNITIIMKPLLQ